jgi:uncharacterized protein YbbK (DUF523 family)
MELKKHNNLIPVCPEQLGGLTTPREPAEIVKDQVIFKSGGDATMAFKEGAFETLNLANLFDCKVAILKKHSPSCGDGLIYDGTFQGVLVEGTGVTAKLLKENGIAVYNEDNFKL